MPLLVVALAWPLLLGAASGAGDVEIRVLEVASGLQCPMYQNLSVADSTSDLVRQMRDLIRDELRGGKSPEEIRAYFVSKWVHPDQPVANAYHGLILVRAGHADRALAFFDRALARDRHLAPALWGKGLVYYDTPGKTAEAIRMWESLLAQDLSAEDREQVASVVARARDRLVSRPPPETSAR